MAAAHELSWPWRGGRVLVDGLHADVASSFGAPQTDTLVKDGLTTQMFILLVGSAPPHGGALWRRRCRGWPLHGRPRVVTYISSSSSSSSILGKPPIH